MRFRFSENNTALKILEQPKPKIHLCPGSEFDTTIITQDIIENREKFLSNIDVVEPTFYDAFKSTVEKLNEGLPDCHFTDVCGTFIMPADTHGGAINTYFYKFNGEIKGGTLYIQANVYGFIEAPKGKGSFLRLAHCNTGNNIITFLEDDGKKLTAGSHRTFTQGYMYMILMLHLFKIHCHVEVKEMRSLGQINVGGSEIRNISKYKMNYLNASWFTEIVSSGAFWVGLKKGGFWKSVAVGPGRSERDNRFILPFMKTGYKRKAGASKFKESLENGPDNEG